MVKRCGRRGSRGSSFSRFYGTTCGGGAIFLCLSFRSEAAAKENSINGHSPGPFKRTCSTYPVSNENAWYFGKCCMGLMGFMGCLTRLDTLALTHSSALLCTDYYAVLPRQLATHYSNIIHSFASWSLQIASMYFIRCWCSSRPSARLHQQRSVRCHRQRTRMCISTLIGKICKLWNHPEEISFPPLVRPSQQQQC